jgi:hypothetical protein
LAGFSAKVDKLVFDTSRFTRSMAEECRKSVREAAQKWLIACLRRIPVRTGFLAGAFTPLENLVGTVNKRTGVISLSSNKLITRERKLAHYQKELVYWEGVKRQAAARLAELSSGKGKGVVESESASAAAGFAKQKHKELEGLRELKDSRKHQKDIQEEIFINKRIERLKKRVAKLLSVRAKSEEAKLTVLRGLEEIRQQLRKAQGKQIEHNPIIKEGIRKRMIREKIQEEIQKPKGLADLRARLKKKADVATEAIQNIGKKKRVKMRAVSRAIQFRVHAFSEYYHPPVGGKILKTPRSGIQFATPENEIFKEFNAVSGELPTEMKLQLELNRMREAVERFRESQTTVSVQGDLGTNVSVPVGASGLTKGQVNALNLAASRQLKDAKSFFSFKFEVNISYYDINDLYERTLSNKRTKNATLLQARQQAIPWYSQYAANAAFMQYLQAKSTWTTLNNINSYLLTRRVTISGNTESETKEITR